MVHLREHHHITVRATTQCYIIAENILKWFEVLCFNACAENCVNLLDKKEDENVLEW